MLDVAEARAALLERLTPASLAIETVDLADAAGRILAHDMIAKSASPPFRRSVMDGYAVRTVDLPGPLPIAFEVPAGASEGDLPPGQCARIFTGAPVPRGADAVIPQENLISASDGVVLEPSDQAWIRPAGDDIQMGQTLMEAGCRLGPAELACLAAGGHAQVPVLAPLCITLLTTGNELREPGQSLASGQIYNTNAVSLVALLRGWGCSVSHQHVLDDRQAMIDALSDAQADLILTVGGVSVGDHDHVRPAIERLGQVEAFRVRMKPGKPFAWGQVADTPVFCLPGNPASAMVTCMLFVKPAIERLRGQSFQECRLPMPADFSAPASDRRRFVRARLTGSGLSVHPNQDSGAMMPMAWATGLAEIPPDTDVQPGDRLNYRPFSDLI